MPRIPNPACSWITCQDGDGITIREVAFIDADRSGGKNALYIFGMKNGAVHFGEPFDFVYPGSTNPMAITPALVTDMQGSIVRGNPPQPGVMEFHFSPNCWVKGFGLKENRHIAHVIVVDYGGTVAPPPSGGAGTLSAEQLDPQTIVLKVS